MITQTIQEGTIITHHHMLGDRDVKVLTVQATSNTAVVQFRELDQTPSEQNTMTVMLDTLR